MYVDEPAQSFLSLHIKSIVHAIQGPGPILSEIRLENNNAAPQGEIILRPIVHSLFPLKETFNLLERCFQPAMNGVSATACY